MRWVLTVGSHLLYMPCSTEREREVLRRMSCSGNLVSVDDEFKKVYPESVLADGDLVFERSGPNERHVRGRRYRRGRHSRRECFIEASIRLLFN